MHALDMLQHPLRPSRVQVGMDNRWTDDKGPGYFASSHICDLCEVSVLATLMRPDKC
uniref:Uncharacterized protein n=1 Tax=Anguilla anguilla TaxID=7936 RepID=A0A0E9XT59_ANGAN